jgi:hypothetical protein
MAIQRDSVSIGQFIHAIRRLPSDKPVVDPQKWYTTQKEHWLRWLREYHTQGAYGRQTGKRRDAKFVYNHIVEPKMLLWLVEAARVKPDLIRAAKRASSRADTLPGKSASIRKHVP